MRFLDTSRIRSRFDERIIAADGTELSADLYLPPRRGRYPALIVRTAADNNRLNRPSGTVQMLPSPADRWKAFAAQGFIVVAADVRGRGDSDGVFSPFVHEASDGACTVDWTRQLAECNGKVGLFGFGYSAFCAWAAAVTDGKVNAVVSISPFGAVGEGLVHRGGAVRLDWLFWMHLIGGRTLQPPNVPPWPKIHRHLPLHSMDAALGREDIWWQEWLEHLDAKDSFWASLDLADRIAALKIPALHITGWWDGQLSGAHYYYDAARKGGAPQQLVIGPWDTAATRRPVARVGGYDFGPRSVLDLDEVLANYFHDSLCTESPSTDSAQVFFTGRNEWVRHKDWLRYSDKGLTLHLGGVLSANTRRGNGLLSTEPIATRGKDVITHNPEVPVDFQPQFWSFAAGANPMGLVLDQMHLSARDEALVYTSAPLDDALTVSGQPKVTLTLYTAAHDADIYVLLSDVFPFGSRDLHLSHGVIRLATMQAFKPGVQFTVELALDPLAHDFFSGHQIRLTIVPSLFPLYARNTHAQNYVSSREISIAEIELHHGGDAVSTLMLPRSQPAHYAPL